MHICIYEYRSIHVITCKHIYTDTTGPVAWPYRSCFPYSLEGKRAFHFPCHIHHLSFKTKEKADVLALLSAIVLKPYLNTRYCLTKLLPTRW